MSKKKELSQDVFGNRMKGYEKSTQILIDPKDHMIVRLDGKKFSKFTKGFLKPFDDILSRVMVQTTSDLLEEFGAVSGYTQSDEITLVLPAMYQKDGKKIINNQISKGRVDKVASVFASTATLRFNMNLLKEFENLSSNTTEEYQEMLHSKLFKAVFDGRAFGVPDDIEAFNAVLWRMRDAEKNSKSMFCQRWVGHKKTLNMNGDEKVILCKKETGQDWNDQRDGYKYGFLIKKQLFKISVDNKYLKYGDEHSSSERTRIIIIEQKINFSEKNVELIMKRKI